MSKSDNNKKTNKEKSKFKKGVRLKCVLSPMISNLFIEKANKELKG